MSEWGRKEKEKEIRFDKVSEEKTAGRKKTNEAKIISFRSASLLLHYTSFASFLFPSPIPR